MTMSAAQQFRYTLAAGATAVVIGVGFTVAGFRSDDSGTTAERASADAPLVTEPPAPGGTGTGADLLLGEGAGGDATPTAAASATAGGAAPTTAPAIAAATTPATRRATPQKPTATKRRTTPPATKPAAGKPPATDGTILDRVLAHINAARGDEGLPALSLDAQLSKAAAIHNGLMTGGCELNHQCPGESGIGDRFSAQGVRWSSAGENIGFRSAGSTDAAIVAAADRITDDMLAEVPPEDGHRRNLLSKNFDRIGLSVVRDGEGIVWVTQDFVG
ncbi:RNA polymerase subunit sigma-70 [Couchioplanes caeruleus subsp. caeruleus]|uniref:RNA polymerase subunit sigma-70 n=1 Tax=Couchioplanes caeruleus subsp. caeruleus TaxID=56427 RepID=A0A1K0GLD2_9ACTN|nr:RNA polymerase subunit sigma-70 [Couchioplanes caeruleus subsp. caeruleus]